MVTELVEVCLAQITHPLTPASGGDQKINVSTPLNDQSKIKNPKFQSGRLQKKYEIACILGVSLHLVDGDGYCGSHGNLDFY